MSPSSSPKIEEEEPSAIKLIGLNLTILLNGGKMFYRTRDYVDNAFLIHGSQRSFNF